MPYRYDNIYTILKKIKDEYYVLPAIQREFVWAERTEERIYNLLDSIVRKYPFGSMLFWECKPEKYRNFINEYRSDEPFYYIMQDNLPKERKIIVLDGQQRLQSLYLAMFGTYNGKQLYFDVFSNPEREVSERRYEFEFFHKDEVEKRNKKIINFKYEDIDEFDYFVPFQGIIHSLSFPKFRRGIIDELKTKIKEWNSEIGDLVDDNLNKVREAFKTSLNLNYFEISEADIENLNMDDILEIFVRINSAGMELTKSDLMFSIIALKMKKDPWEMFTQLLNDLHKKYSNFEFDKDFIIKCFLVIEGLGARYEVGKLRDLETIRHLEEKFNRIGESIKWCMDFIKKDAKIMCGGILGSYNALIPLIYWIFNQDNLKKILPSEYERIKHFIYASLYTRATTRYAESRIDKLLKKYGRVNRHFPIEESLEFIRDHERPTEIDEELLNLNVDLTLNILQDGVSLEPGYSGNKPERDHIFPRSLLSGRYPDSKINHFANFWFIPMGMNRNKYNSPPLKYFKRTFGCTGESLKKRLLREKVLPLKGSLDLLQIGHFEDFIETRKQMILKKAKNFLKY